MKDLQIVAILQTLVPDVDLTPFITGHVERQDFLKICDGLYDKLFENKPKPQQLTEGDSYV